MPGKKKSLKKRNHAKNLHCTVSHRYISQILHETTLRKGTYIMVYSLMEIWPKVYWEKRKEGNNRVTLLSTDQCLNLYGGVDVRPPHVCGLVARSGEHQLLVRVEAERVDRAAVSCILQQARTALYPPQTCCVV